MEADPEPTRNAASQAAVSAARASRRTLPKLPLLVAVIGLGAAATGGAWWKQRANQRVLGELQAIQAEAAGLEAQAAGFRARCGSLHAELARLRDAAKRGDEPTQVWARERARLFEAFVSRVERGADEPAFSRMQSALRAACAEGDAAHARKLLLQVPELRFPSPTRFRELQNEGYLKPLAALSRQNPAFYRAFRDQEPVAAAEDAAALRRELAAADLDTPTPQSLLQLELYNAVAPAGDPLADDWAALSTAADYFVLPDAATLAAWRRAQRAIRQQDWSAAVGHMQSILKTTVRTRVPFRAAYARTRLKNKPDDRAVAYPFLQEAAAAGDAEARRWMADEELRRGQPTAAVRWLEQAIEAGDSAAVAPLLELYGRAAVRRDAAREAGVLERILVAPDAPPYAALLLARLYEYGDGVPASSGNAFAYYARAAERKHAAAFPDLARCHLRGIGTAVDTEQAIAWAMRAWAAGEREATLPLLSELLQADPDRAAGPLQELVDHEQVIAPSGFANIKEYGPSMARLQAELGRYFDLRGRFAEAARHYARAGAKDPSVRARHAALTTGRACETCRGTGKIQNWVACATCGGRGTIVCHLCDGRGYALISGTPPCTTCGGSGVLMQQGRNLACGACEGSGKGKGSVIRKPCAACSQGREPCPECQAGQIKVTKECPECRGAGVRALAQP